MSREPNYRKELVKLSNAVMNHVAALDVLMKLPSTVERGREVAKLTNTLEIINDGVRYFALGVDYRKDKKSHPAGEGGKGINV